MDAYYDEDEITIFHGDCGEVLPHLPSESVDLCCTDPPYGVAYRGRFDRKHAQIVGDDDLSWLEPIFSEVHRVMKPDSLSVCFYGWPYAETFVRAWKRVGFRLVSHLCFVKNVPGLGHFTRSGHETAFLLAKGRPAPPAGVIVDTIDWHREHEIFHPNQKPLAAITRIVDAFAPGQGLVLDPFLGSGTTLRAAKDLGLRGSGIEIEESYCVKASRRMAQGVLPFRRVKAAKLDQAELFAE